MLLKVQTNVLMFIELFTRNTCMGFILQGQFYYQGLEILKLIIIIIIKKKKKKIFFGTSRPLRSNFKRLEISMLDKADMCEKLLKSRRQINLSGTKFEEFVTRQ